MSEPRTAAQSAASIIGRRHRDANPTDVDGLAIPSRRGNIRICRCERGERRHKRLSRGRRCLRSSLCESRPADTGDVQEAPDTREDYAVGGGDAVVGGDQVGDVALIEAAQSLWLKCAI